MSGPFLFPRCGKTARMDSGSFVRWVMNKAHIAAEAWYRERKRQHLTTQGGGKRIAAKNWFGPFATYRDYLKSDLWAGIRERVLDAANRQCRLCQNVATQVHHRHYGKRTLTGKTLIHLIAVCGACHIEIEFDGEAKRTRKQADDWLLARLECEPEQES